MPDFLTIEKRGEAYIITNHKGELTPEETMDLIVLALKLFAGIEPA